MIVALEKKKEKTSQTQVMLTLKNMIWKPYSYLQVTVYLKC